MTDLFARLEKTRSLDESFRAEIEEAFGNRGKKALAAIDAGKIKKFLDFFVVEGRTASYVVDEDFCTCRDFMYRGRTCWHLIAVKIVARTGMFEKIDRWYVDSLSADVRDNS